MAEKAGAALAGITPAEVELTEAERQVLIAHLELDEPVRTPNNNHYRFHPRTLDQAASYFRGLRVDDWTSANRDLVSSGLMCRDHHGGYALTAAGRQAARRERQHHPPIWYWYREFYPAAATSAVYGRFCERLYGRDLRQSGFSDLAQIDRLASIGALTGQSQILEVGCGLGMTGEYLVDRYGGSVLGLDNTPEAVALAAERTRTKRERVGYAVGDLNRLDQPAAQLGPDSFDVIVSIDSLYFADDLPKTLSTLHSLLNPGGRIMIFWSCFAFDPQTPRSALSVDGNPLATALRTLGLRYTAFDFSEEVCHLMRAKHRLATRMRDRFKDEGTEMILEHLLTESDGTTEPFDRQTCNVTRFLYRVDR